MYRITSRITLSSRSRNANAACCRDSLVT